MGVTVGAYMMGFERELAPVKVAEEVVGDDEEGRKLNFDLDEWFWTEDFLNNNVYGLAVESEAGS